MLIAERLATTCGLPRPFLARANLFSQAQHTTNAPRLQAPAEDEGLGAACFAHPLGLRIKLL